MIILEGPDGSGKSTLAAKLSKHFNMPVMKIGASPGDAVAVRQYCQTCEDRVLQPVIQDRVTQISERVYSSIFGRCLIPPAELTDRLGRLLYNMPIVIYCRVDDLSKVVHLASDPKDTPEYIAAVTANMRKIRDAYDTIMWSRSFQPHFCTYDYTITSGEQHEQFLENLSGSLRIRAELFASGRANT